MINIKIINEEGPMKYTSIFYNIPEHIAKSLYSILVEITNNMENDMRYDEKEEEIKE